jgi:ribosomal protein S12 methylthiotransferase accessory factor
MEMKISFPGGKKVDAHYRGFTIQTDQAVDSGGEGSAPEPFDLFLASIGTCVGINILSFCQYRDISVEKMRLVQHMERSPDKKRVTKIHLEITLPPDFPKKYKDAIVRVAKLCAVKRHMETPPEFFITTIVADE